MNRRSFIMAAGSALFLPAREPVRAYSFVGGWRERFAYSTQLTDSDPGDGGIIYEISVDCGETWERVDQGRFQMSRGLVCMARVRMNMNLPGKLVISSYGPFQVEEVPHSRG